MGTDRSSKRQFERTDPQSTVEQAIQKKNDEKQTRQSPVTATMVILLDRWLIGRTLFHPCMLLGLKQLFLTL